MATIYKAGDRVVTDGGGYFDDDTGAEVERDRAGTVMHAYAYNPGEEPYLYDVVLDGNVTPSTIGVGGGLAFYPSEIVGREKEV